MGAVVALVGVPANAAAPVTPVATAPPAAAPVPAAAAPAPAAPPAAAATTTAVPATPAPVALLRATSPAVAGAPLTLDGSASTPAADIRSYTWTVTRGGKQIRTVTTTPLTSVRPAQAGPVRISLAVTDAQGRTAEAAEPLLLTVGPALQITPAAPATGPAAKQVAPTKKVAATKKVAVVKKPAVVKPAAVAKKAAVVKQPTVAQKVTAAKKVTPTAHAAATTSVTIKDFSFGPSSVTIHAGDTVSWTNNGPTDHNAVASNGSFSTPTLKKGASASHTFNTAGTIAYICSLHPFMAGKVTVLAAAATTTTPKTTTTPSTSSSTTTPSSTTPSASSSSSATPSATATTTPSAVATPTGSQLPTTGSEPAFPALVGAGLIGAGLYLRRRPRVQP
jgi:LPXTG-motif cell wall-anchored protein